MPGVAPQQSRTFDPVAAQAALRRDRVAKIRTTLTQKTTFTPGKAPVNGTVTQTSDRRAPDITPPTLPSSVPDRTPGRVGPSLPPPMNANRMPVAEAPSPFPTVRPGESIDDARARENTNGAPDAQQPAQNDGPQNPFPTVRPGESLDNARAREEEERRRARELHKKTYQPAPPLPTPPPPESREAPAPDEDDNARAAADRQMNAAEESGDFAAQNRARAMQNRAQKKAADRAAPTDDGEPSEAMQALSKFVTHGSATTGIGILLTQSVMFYRFFLTVYPSYDERLRSWGMLNLVPGKYDLRKTTDIFDLILCIVELGLFLILLVVGFVIFLVLVRAIV